MTPALLVIAKEPRPGRVKTRLCPPCTPRQAATVAEAALRDTLDAGTRSAASDRIIVLSGQYRPPVGWSVLPQHGKGLGERLANAFHDAAIHRPGSAALLIGMDTPHVTATILARVGQGLKSADAVLGRAVDGGWWALALRDPLAARVLRSVPMSTPDTGQLTFEALRCSGLRVVEGPVLRDVDTAADAHEVAQVHPHGRFAAAVAIHVPTGVFQPLPDEGRWDSVLLVDGNIGIGGDPVALLKRAGEPLNPQGTVMVEVVAPGDRTWTGPVRILHAQRRSTPFPWASVSTDDIAAVATRAGLRTCETWTEERRWFVRLAR